MSSKRANGQFYTLGNPFTLIPFKRWAQSAGLPDTCILEPFAGANNIIETLQSVNLCNSFRSYDLFPASRKVRKRNTILSFPKGFDVCVTNPPWLARNSATRRGLSYPDSAYDDLYKHCLELCLKHCKYVAALIPASYLQSGLFRDRLKSYILLHSTLFTDTENPVCLSLFTGEYSERIDIYYDNTFVGTLNQLRGMLPDAQCDKKVRFNDPAGKLGFISFDNTKEPSIKFCCVNEIKDYPIKVSSRFITRISGDFDNITTLIKKLNKNIQKFRNDTKDIFLTPFKGMREDGQYRRRMEFSLARRFINAS